MKGNFINHYRTPIKWFTDINGCNICCSHLIDRDGYPLIHRNGKQWRMNRFIYYHLKGYIPNDMVVRHICDNPSCINPNHLIIGTTQDNTKDRELRGKSSRGEGNGNSKLKEKEVIEIFYDRETPRSKLAKKYNIDLSQISDIHKKQGWKSIVGNLEISKK